MYDYSKQIDAYQKDKVAINKNIQDKLRNHRRANQERLKTNIKEGVTVNQSSFIKQGSYANKTMIQAIGNDYDIDDGVIFKKEDLEGENGAEMSALDTRKMVKKSLKCEKFNKEPELKKNCIRVFYSEGHHVDVPSYRKYEDSNGNEILELASVDWKRSDPSLINKWFETQASLYNEIRSGRSLQLRRMIRLLKRFSKSRPSWNMPSGIILTMLVVSNFPDYEKDDECFYYLLKKINDILAVELRVYNLADNSYPQEELTKPGTDPVMQTLQSKITEALDKLEVLFAEDCTNTSARKAWDWVFKSDGFFEEYDEETSGSKATTVNSFSQKASAVDINGGGKFA